MKKKIFALVLCLALLLTSTAFAADGPAKTTSNKSALPDTPEYTFDVSPEHRMPWPITRLSYNITVDHPFEFQRKEILDHENSHPGEWTRMEPVELYEWSDGSWRNSIPTDTPATQLVKEPFYLMEEGYYYRVVADFSGRTDNIGMPYYPNINYSMHNVYSGMLGAGRTGIISVELDESVYTSTKRGEDADCVCIIHRARLRVASVDGVNFIPQAYASNINGLFIITYFPSESTNRRDYYTETTMDLILKQNIDPDLKQNSFQIPLHNVLY